MFSFVPRDEAVTARIVISAGNRRCGRRGRCPTNMSSPTCSPTVASPKSGLPGLVASGVRFIAAVSHRSMRQGWVQRVAWLWKQPNTCFAGTFCPATTSWPSGAQRRLSTRNPAGNVSRLPALRRRAPGEPPPCCPRPRHRSICRRARPRCRCCRTSGCRERGRNPYADAIRKPPRCFRPRSSCRGLSGPGGRTCR